MSITTRLKRYWKKVKGLNEFYFPPGHFYNPLSSKEEIRNLASYYFATDNIEIDGINIDANEMKKRLIKYIDYYKNFESLYCSADVRNFNINNGYYTYSDAIFLFSILLENKPTRYFEVGSGFSSLLTIETDQLCLGNSIDKKFIEPYPENRLLKLLNGNEIGVEIIAKKIQDVPLTLFETLECNDILFIDSSHVSKMGSDLNHVVFKILPILKSGVLIHFHDVFYPFEYPENWATSNRWHSWNEAYLLRAFLMYNKAFEIIFWNSYCEINFESIMKQSFPLYYNGGSSSLWIQKK